jgi:hypothetical protein
MSLQTAATWKGRVPEYPNFNFSSALIALIARVAWNVKVREVGSHDPIETDTPNYPPKTGWGRIPKDPAFPVTRTVYASVLFQKPVIGQSGPFI